MASARVPLAEYEARRIALIKPSALGDIIHSLPVLSALRRRYPTAHIAWVVNSAYEPLLQGHPDLTETVPFDRGALRHGRWHGTRTAVRFLRRLRNERFDLVLDLQGLFRSGIMTAATGAARRIGLSTAREGAAWMYTDVVNVPAVTVTHAVDRYWLLAKALGAGGGTKSFTLPQPATEAAWAEALLRECPRPWLAMAVGARWTTKRWPPAAFAALARRAQEHGGGTILLVGGSEDRILAHQVAVAITGSVLDLTGRTTLPRLAAVLARADVVLANDTGPLHLAAALGRPVLAPYTCTRATLTGPYGQLAGAIETRVACQGSLLRTCPHMVCLDELTPDRLWPQLREILQTWQNTRRSA